MLHFKIDCKNPASFHATSDDLPLCSQRRTCAAGVRLQASAPWSPWAPVSRPRPHSPRPSIQLWSLPPSGRSRWARPPSGWRRSLVPVPRCPSLMQTLWTSPAGPGGAEVRKEMKYQQTKRWRRFSWVTHSQSRFIGSSWLIIKWHKTQPHETRVVSIWFFILPQTPSADILTVTCS